MSEVSKRALALVKRETVRSIAAPPARFHAADCLVKKWSKAMLCPALPIKLPAYYFVAVVHPLGIDGIEFIEKLDQRERQAKRAAVSKV